MFVAGKRDICRPVFVPEWDSTVSIYRKDYYEHNCLLILTLIIICSPLHVANVVHEIRELCGCILLIDTIRCTYKATFLFTALFRSMTYFRKSIKSRLVLSGTRSTDIPLWETGLNDSHVGSTVARRSYPMIPLLNIKRRRRKNSQSITRFTLPCLLLKRIKYIASLRTLSALRLIFTRVVVPCEKIIFW